MDIPPSKFSPMTYSSLGNDLLISQTNAAVAPDCRGAAKEAQEVGIEFGGVEAKTKVS
ncbi:hypothetical protein TorRG33x02_313190 [Trema orientale]|uniref:Uncharacterized protein n=1 Tax=Trema orientale TaxID=63057 RepID=A0A2P5BPU2_TREOI|nr:hypothetical protein TorRG33x02_313190 [Trema orientale]